MILCNYEWFALCRLTHRKFTTFFACSAEQLARRLQAPPQSFVTKKYVCELGVSRSTAYFFVSHADMYPTCLPTSIQQQQCIHLTDLDLKILWLTCFDIHSCTLAPDILQPRRILIPHFRLDYANKIFVNLVKRILNPRAFLIWLFLESQESITLTSHYWTSLKTLGFTKSFKRIPNPRAFLSWIFL